jgi:crossover junction endodeoxyribonuclease RuvC
MAMADVVVLGLDLSLTSTGAALAGGNGGKYSTSVLRPPAGRHRGHDRLLWLVDEVEAEAKHADLIVVEGPAFGAKGSAYHQLAGLWWLVVHALWLHNLPVAIAPPAAVKRYATGRGNAGKDLVLASVVRRFPDFAGGNDEADALILAALGAEHLGHPIVDMPAAHRTALSGVDWPEVRSP